MNKQFVFDAFFRAKIETEVLVTGVYGRATKQQVTKQFVNNTQFHCERFDATEIPVRHRNETMRFVVFAQRVSMK